MPAFAMLYLAGAPERLAADAVVQAMRTDWPTADFGALEATRSEPGEPIMLTLGESIVALIPVAAATGEDLAAIAGHSRLWPHDRPAPVGHQSHLIVTVMGVADGHRRAVEAMVLLSRAVVSVIGLSGGVQAVQFGGSNQLILPELLVDIAQQVLPEPILPAWVAFNVGQRSDGVMTGHTRGMTNLALMDIEIPATRESAESVFTWLTNIAQYLVDNGPVIEHGNTIGATVDAEVIAHHAPSAYDAAVTVLQLQFDADEPLGRQEPKRKWFGRSR